MCIDELHLGRFTLLLCTDPIADLVVAFALVGDRNDKALLAFLANLKSWGLLPRLVVSDGSNLYPRVLAELWRHALHQLCVFHIIKDINDLIIKAVRRLAGALARRGNSGRKRQVGRPSKARQAALANAGPTLKEKAGFILKHRFLIVKNTAEFDKQDWETLVEMFAYLGELPRRCGPLPATSADYSRRRHGCRRCGRGERRCCETGYKQSGRNYLRRCSLLEAEKFKKAVAFVYSPAVEKVRTNNHVERTNRDFRFSEKLRYNCRTGNSIVRFVLLTLGSLVESRRR